MVQWFRLFSNGVHSLNGWFSQVPNSISGRNLEDASKTLPDYRGVMQDCVLGPGPIDPHLRCIGFNVSTHLSADKRRRTILVSKAQHFKHIYDSGFHACLLCRDLNQNLSMSAELDVFAIELSKHRNS